MYSIGKFFSENISIQNKKGVNSSSFLFAFFLLFTILLVCY
jgi:hypothetical protein